MFGVPKMFSNHIKRKNVNIIPRRGMPHLLVFLCQKKIILPQFDNLGQVTVIWDI